MRGKIDLIPVLVVLGNGLAKFVETQGMGVANTVLIQGLARSSDDGGRRGKVGLSNNHAYNLGGLSRASLRPGHDLHDVKRTNRLGPVYH